VDSGLGGGTPKEIKINASNSGTKKDKNASQAWKSGVLLPIFAVPFRKG
jgi:hypothetical protein